MGGMEEREKESGAARIMIFAVVGVLIALPVIYVLSTGPAMWLNNHRYISSDEGFVWEFYGPLRWVTSHCKPVNDFVLWYVNLFGLLPNF